MKVEFTVKNLDGIEYQDLTLGNTYRVIGIGADDYRIINDEGLPYLYPPALFSIVDKHEPADWITEYEDYFDDDPQAIAVFRQYLATQRIRRSGWDTQSRPDIFI